MAGFKKNIWAFYSLLLVVSFILFVWFARYHYTNHIDKFQDKQLLQLELFSSSFESQLKSQESLLEVIGHQVIDQNDFTRTAALQVRPLMDDLLSVHPAIASFSLINAQGQPVAVSSGLTLSDLGNQSSDPLFVQSLESSTLIVGRTTYVDALNALVIPISKSIRNRSGEIVAVMSAGLRVDSPILFSKAISNIEHTTISLIHDDNYLSFTSRGRLDFTRYLSTTSDVERKIVFDKLNREFGKTEDAVKLSGESISSVIGESQYYATITAKYLPDYHLWAFARSDLIKIQFDFLIQLTLYLAIFIIIQIAFYFAIRHIATNEEHTKNRLFHQSTHDSLTGLPNRQYLRHYIKDWLNHPSQSFTLMYVDVDNFKSVNDTHGHAFGDRVLLEITKRLKTFSGKNRWVVREASDEFIILMPDADREALNQRAQQLIDILATPYCIDGNQFLLSTSIGITRYPDHGLDLDSLLRSADIAMYQAKKERNAYCYFDGEMQTKHLNKMKMEQRLRQAIEKRHLFMVYQPQVTINGDVHGVEALVRWIDDELGFVPPDQFIPIAETTGSMAKLGQLIIEKSIEDIAKYNHANNQQLRLSINISVKQFLQSDFISHFMQTIEHFGLAKHLVTLEITENLFIEDLAKFTPICTKLHEYGIQISLDDFGTGFSSLSMLKALPIDELKIDKSFIDHIDFDSKALTMVQNIIAIGKIFNMKVLAEGVENAEQRSQLQSSGCDLIQGYFYSKPLPYQDLVTYLDQQKGSSHVISKSPAEA